MLYHDSHKYQSKNLSVHHGKLDVNLDGGAAFFFRPTPDTKGQTYGRFKIKFKVTGGFGYSAAVQLWPIVQPGETEHQAWSRGEIDFPEGRFGPTRQIFGFHHTTNCTPGLPGGDPRPHGRDLHGDAHHRDQVDTSGRQLLHGWPTAHHDRQTHAGR